MALGSYICKSKRLKYCGVEDELLGEREKEEEGECFPWAWSLRDLSGRGALDVIN